MSTAMLARRTDDYSVLGIFYAFFVLQYCKAYFFKEICRFKGYENERKNFTYGWTCCRKIY